MKLHRFFVAPPLSAEQVSGEEAFSSSDQSLSHQLKDVFRFQAGDKVVIFDGSGSDFLSEIVSLSKGGTEFHVVEKHQNMNARANETWLLQAIVKKDNFEWIAEKATELGVSRLMPVLSDRSEKKDVNRERLDKIAKEAAEQSGRAELPLVNAPMPLESALSAVAEEGASLIVLHTDASAEPFEKALSALASSPKIALAIGPEGGWSEADVALFRERGAVFAHFGLPGQVLRAETAAIAALSLALLPRQGK